MTVLVGVKCTDGVVIGADSIATSAMGSSPLVHLTANNKIQIFSGSVIVAATGAVGFAQRLHIHVDAAISGGVFKSFTKFECASNISRRLLTDFQNTMVQVSPPRGIGFGALMAATIKNEPCLFEFGTSDFQPELKDGKLFFVSMGSGQVLADPFLAFVSRVLWKDKMPSVSEAKFGVYWALSHTIKLAPGGVGGPVKIAVLQKRGAIWVAEEMSDNQEPAQYISELEDYIGGFATRAIAEAPSLPPPSPPSSAPHGTAST